MCAFSIKKVNDFYRKIHGCQEIKYDVSINRGLLNLDNSVLANACGANNSKSTHRLVVIDSVVDKLYRQQFDTYFATWGILPIWKVVSAGESSKTMEQAINVANAMTEAGLLRRAEAVIAIGGGVLLDIVGFAASLYRRGIPYIRIPTTLMAQIDAGIGVKTGVNYGHHKNRLGTYFPPVATLIDPEFLKTLDQRHITNGVAEIIKMALVKDKPLFQLLEKKVGKLNARTFSNHSLEINEIFSRAIDGMLDELEPNLWETVLERAVDYGHTFSPSLELCANPPLLHGEAVAIDMALSIVLALYRNLLTEHEAERALQLIKGVGLPLTHQDFILELVEKGLKDSTKHRNGLQRVPLTTGIGKVTFINDLTQSELNNALKYIDRYTNKSMRSQKVTLHIGYKNSSLGGELHCLA